MVHFTLGQRQLLQSTLKETIARLRGEISGAMRGNTAGIGLANHMNEVDDQAVADLETAIDIAQVERDLKQLREAQDALARLKTPDYGLCPQCHGTIAFSRLKADPAARRCVNCQALAEAMWGRKPPSL